MKFCVLGGGGYIGQLLAQQLLKSDHEVTVFDLSFSHIPYISFDWTRVNCVKSSILNETKLKEALQNCDACFHLAAYGMSGGASLDKKMTHLVNVEGTKMVIDACVAANCKRLVYTSTVTVSFGPDEVYNLTEDAPYLKTFLTPYAESKCIAEQKVLSAAKEGRLQTCALRLRGVYGPGEVRTTEKTFKLCAKGLIVATFEKTFPCYSQYSGAENVVQALIKAEKSLAKNGFKSPTNGNAYNIVDDGKVLNFAFWFPLITLLGLKLPRFKAPYLLVYYFAYFLELLWHLFKIEPLLTRLEINIVALNNTYSIEKAKQDFGYNPVNNHCLSSTLEYYENFGKTSFKTKKWKMEKNYLNAMFFLGCGILFCLIWQ